MSSRILAITALSAGLAALPLMAIAQTGTPSSNMPSGSMPSGSTSSGMSTGTGMSGGYGSTSPTSGTMSSGSMGSFDARHYRTGADCLNAAVAAHVDLSACNNLRNR